RRSLCVSRSSRVGSDERPPAYALWAHRRAGGPTPCIRPGTDWGAGPRSGSGERQLLAGVGEEGQELIGCIPGPDQLVAEVLQQPVSLGEQVLALVGQPQLLKGLELTLHQPHAMTVGEEEHLRLAALALGCELAPERLDVGAVFKCLCLTT